MRLHLLADPDYQDSLVRFIENHDEPRAASILEPAREKAAAVATLTQTGARLVHDGQIEGRQVHLPMFLGRFPVEPTDIGLATFYATLLAASATRRSARVAGSSANARLAGQRQLPDLVAWSWDGATRWLVVVNLSDTTAAGTCARPGTTFAAGRWRLATRPRHIFERDGDDLCDGLYVELGPWQLAPAALDPTPDATG